MMPLSFVTLGDNVEAEFDEFPELTEWKDA
jgi:hypothetical protein